MKIQCFVESSPRGSWDSLAVDRAAVIHLSHYPPIMSVTPPTNPLRSKTYRGIGKEVTKAWWTKLLAIRPWIHLFFAEILEKQNSTWGDNMDQIVWGWHIIFTRSVFRSSPDCHPDRISSRELCSSRLLSTL